MEHGNTGTIRPCSTTRTPSRSGGYLAWAWRRFRAGFVAIACCAAPLFAAENDAGIYPFIKQEQVRIRYRDPASLPSVYVPPTPPPPTVGGPLPEDAWQPLSLDDAIRIALDDSEVVRVLAGTVAVSSGRTIYDPAIANTAVDQQRAAFDPTLTARNTWTQTDTPFAIIDPLDPGRALLGASKTENHNFSLDVSQTNLSGGRARFGFSNDASRFAPGVFPLNPQNRYRTELSYTQPILRGRGVLANRVPIVLARIDTERSFFQYRDSVQELVRGVIEAYWAVVFARTDVWARQIQVKQAEESYQFSKARHDAGFTAVQEVAQANAALAGFRANLIGAQANLLTREAALQNILGIPPTVPFKFVPTTPPTRERIQFDWNLVHQTAEERRPDLIELKLVLEADQQRLLLANNQMQPNLDLVSLYRWNGLEGRMPNQTRIGTNGNEATDWTLGVNFSVPLFLRQERAAQRSAQLLIARDRAVLQQGIHAMQHILATNFRNLDQFYLQYGAFREARKANRQNLEQQFAAYRSGRETLFLNVLQAISDWGNSVSQEAQSLAQFNSELANLERQTGTILETHGVFFYEDRFCTLGPLWVAPNRCRLYARDIHPGNNNTDRYPTGDEPAENFFDLDDYPQRLPSTDPEGKPYRPSIDIPEAVPPRDAQPELPLPNP